MAPGMTSGLRRRLLLLLLLPLLLVGALNTWFDFRQADDAALQQDRQLLSLVPMLADSVVARGTKPDDPPVMLTAPPIDDFLGDRNGMAAFAVLNMEGEVLLGDGWLTGLPPTTGEPEFLSEENGGATYRIVSQRVNTAAGELVVRLADGSDARQSWFRNLAIKVLLPNMVLMIAGVFAVNWAVSTALRPLLALADAVERRSPHDLTSMDPDVSPNEVRPLVLSLNRLLGLVNAQAESQARFVADAAHQLRTPLAGLQAQVEAWGQVANVQATVTLKAEQIHRLQRAARRTSQLANQLLALSRADARSADTQSMQRVDLRQLCEVLLETHLDAAMAKDIDLGMDAAAAHANGHEWLLREMLTNLIDNAIKYTPHGGHVTLRCGLRTVGPAQTEEAFVEVEDDGPGVPPAERRRMLERFYRVPGSAGEGNGLGLAIAEEIARVHRSHLVAEAGANGQGLRISMQLPN